VRNGLEFELIDGDRTDINDEFLIKVMNKIEEKEKLDYGKELSTFIVAIIGP